MPAAGPAEVSYALAFGAGLVASVNPCGFALLPPLLFYYLGTTGRQRGAGRLADGLVAGLVLTSGFMLVFGLVGLVFALGARAVVRVVPWVTVGMGGALVVLGGWLVTGRHLSVRLPGLRTRPGEDGGYGSLFLFGTAFAVGSLSCTLPVFLLVVGSALATGSVVGTLGAFLAYALGMSTVLMVLCLGTAGFREVLVRKVRRLFPYLNRISGVLLILGGGYVVYYWTALLTGADRSAPIRLLQNVQRWAQDVVIGVGDQVWVLVGIALAAAALLALAVRILRRGGTADDRAVDEHGAGPQAAKDREETRA